VCRRLCAVVYDIVNRCWKDMLTSIFYFSWMMQHFVNNDMGLGPGLGPVYCGGGGWVGFITMGGGGGGHRGRVLV
jgi:hypothetical protein